MSCFGALLSALIIGCGDGDTVNSTDPDAGAASNADDSGHGECTFKRKKRHINVSFAPASSLPAGRCERGF